MFKEYYRRAANDETMLYGRSWLVRKPKAIVVFVHGMCESSDRYVDFAPRVNGIGFDVYAEDLLGHGYNKQGHRGAFADKTDGLKYQLEDIRALIEKAKADSGDLPVIAIGIGFGSTLVLLEASLCKNVDFIISIAPPSAPTGMPALMQLARNHIMLNGHTSVSTSVYNMMIQHGKLPSVPNEEHAFYWISTDPDAVKEFVEDENTGFPLAASGCLEVMKAYRALASEDVMMTIPNVPIYIVAGSEDHTGDCGEAPKELATMLSRTGHDQVRMKLYFNAYHDILHESCTDEVVKDLLAWMNIYV